MSKSLTVGKRIRCCLSYGTLVGDSDIDYWEATGETFSGSYNVGFAGDTCRDKADKIEAFIKVFSPRKIVLICGENDLAEGASSTETFKRLEAVITTTSAADLQTVYFSTKPEPLTKIRKRKNLQYDLLLKAVTVYRLLW